MINVSQVVSASFSASTPRSKRSLSIIFGSGNSVGRIATTTVIADDSTPTSRCKRVLSFSSAVGKQPEQPETAAPGSITFKRITRAEAAIKSVSSTASKPEAEAIPIAMKNLFKVQPPVANFLLDEIERELLAPVTRDEAENVFLSTATAKRRPTKPLAAAASVAGDDCYRSFLEAFTSRNPPALAESEFGDEEDDDLYRQSSSESENSESDEERSEDALSSAGSSLKCNQVTISERELTDLYEESLATAAQKTAHLLDEKRLLKIESEGESMTFAQRQQIGEQLREHFQLLLQSTALIIVGGVSNPSEADFSTATIALLQWLFEFKFFADFFLFGIDNDQSTKSIFCVPGIDRLRQFYSLVVKFQPSLKFVFEKPSLVRSVPERFLPLPITRLPFGNAPKEDSSGGSAARSLLSSFIGNASFLFRDCYDFSTWQRSVNFSSGEDRFFQFFDVSGSHYQNGIAGSQSKFKFLPPEDHLLLLGLKRFFFNWEKIQNRLLPTKTVRQIQIRFKNLTTRRSPPNPVKSFSLGLAAPLSEEEVELLYRGVRLLGKDFHAISATFLPYRTAAILSKLWHEMDYNRRRPCNDSLQPGSAAEKTIKAANPVLDMEAYFDYDAALRTEQAASQASVPLSPGITSDFACQEFFPLSHGPLNCASLPNFIF